MKAHYIYILVLLFNIFPWKSKYIQLCLTRNMYELEGNLLPHLVIILRKLYT